MTWLVKQKGKPDKVVDDCNEQYNNYIDVKCDHAKGHRGSHRFSWQKKEKS
jgi:hypothetical protein